MSKQTSTALIIGGGLAGMEAALKVAQAGYRVVLVEKEPILGGIMNSLYSSFPRWENPQELVNYKIKQLKNNPFVEIMTSTTLESCQRNGELFNVNLASADGKVKRGQVQAVVIATGFDLFDASVYGEYGYGIYPNVVNSLEYEALLKKWAETNTKPPQAVAFFKCVGSRDRSKGNPYCSKICCMYTAKQAGVTKEINPETKCYVFYMDYRATGKEYEEFVRNVIEQRKVRYVRGRPAKVIPENNRLLIRAEDTLMGIPIEVAVDMVVLAAAIVPRKETASLAGMLGAATDEYGFIEPLYGEPVMAKDRVFFAGGCGFAVEAAGAQHQGAAAAANVIDLFNQDMGGD